jgi:RHS repeat-associated protein
VRGEDLPRTRALTSAGEVELGIDLGCGVSLDTPVDAQDRLCRYGNYDYVYDDNGRLATKTQISTSDETAYTYDGLGRLRRVVLPDSTQIDYVHDALGRRIGKVVDGQLEKGWLYGNDSLRPMAQRDEGGEIEMTFVYETRVNVPDYIVDLEAPSKTYRVITDHLGSVRLVINVATGAVVQRMDYDEFGNVLNDTNPGFQPFGFAGGLYDADTGLVRFGARDYDAGTGRWTAKDPILFEGGTANLYEYVGNDPINSIDPSGLALKACAKALAELAAAEARHGKRVLEDMCSPNGPDPGHDKAIEQAKNAVDNAREKVRRYCTDRDLAILGAAGAVAIGVGVGIAIGGAAGGVAGGVVVLAGGS